MNNVESQHYLKCRQLCTHAFRKHRCPNQLSPTVLCTSRTKLTLSQIHKALNSRALLLELYSQYGTYRGTHQIVGSLLQVPACGSIVQRTETLKETTTTVQSYHCLSSGVLPTHKAHLISKRHTSIGIVEEGTSNNCTKGNSA